MRAWDLPPPRRLACEERGGSKDLSWSLKIHGKIQGFFFTFLSSLTLSGHMLCLPKTGKT